MKWKKGQATKTLCTVLAACCLWHSVAVLAVAGWPGLLLAVMGLCAAGFWALLARQAGMIGEDKAEAKRRYLRQQLLGRGA